MILRTGARRLGLIGALIGGIATAAQGADRPVAPDPLFDMNAKFVIAETVIGATDGLIRQGWASPGTEARVDRLRRHPDRDSDPYAGVRAAAEAQAEAGLWSEAGLKAWLDVIETPAAELYPVIAAALLSGEGSLPDMVESRLWYGGDPLRLGAATSLLEIEIATQTRFLDLPAEVIWSATPPIDAQEAERIGLDRLIPGAPQPSGSDGPGL
jgi:hypothetical protein